ncbi:Polysaccharide pyruvyl transferase [Neorhodopirellula lusitana]|uniref:Polysaccharide pyruvyl transferase n=1 Tax=Neorhodopirellula lusitana TaxID=445327 RepID=A0ABY1QQL1_9BACT|nr:polysaccharide pyruvyl transferase family protein [Neorhodopirellula lusitana]SMP76015.1 Polysaccharide pyruvyl transferase [Neorhodopirellula lusitana]
MKRRHFLACTLGLSLAKAVQAGGVNRVPRILLRSSWQCVNIGDIAHTPGVLALIEQHIPGCEVVLWASSNLTAEVADMEHKRFPNLKIVKGSIRDDGSTSSPELASAIAESDFLLHGSGPSLVAAKDVAAYVKHTGKPFGVYGITYASEQWNDLLSRAEFVFFRDSVSLQYAIDHGVHAPIMEFGPDGAFACDLRNDEKAIQFLDQNDLVDGEFLCCLSRLRHTPYWTIPGRNNRVRPEFEVRNNRMKEHDHVAIRETIVRVVRETNLKVLLCPEDMTQMSVGKEMLYDQLPDDVKSRVVWRKDFWLTDEALSVYVRSAGLFGSEMHSPIMAIGNGIPAVVCRFKEQTSKGFMWNDIGLGEWLFDLDEDNDIQERLPATVLAIAKNPESAKVKTMDALTRVKQFQKETMGVVREQITKSVN